MPNYEYHCSNKHCECDTFQTYQSIREDLLKECPYCGEKTIERTFHAVPVMISNEPKTLGSLAELNRKKFGRAYCEDQEQKMREERLSASEFVGSLPKGAKTIKREAKDTPWRKAYEKVDTSLAKLDKEQRHKYIMTGKK